MQLNQEELKLVLLAIEYMDSYEFLDEDIKTLYKKILNNGRK